MTAKEYLRQIRRLDEVIDAKLEQVHQLRSRAEKMTSGIPTADGVQSSMDQDRLGSTIAKMVDLEREIKCSVDRLIDMKQLALDTIKQIPDNRYKMILIHYYFNRQTWEQIAVDMGFTYQWVCRLHGQALQEFEKNSKS